MINVLRQEVWEKYGGRCAYCGEEITLKEMQIDHIFPKHLKHWLDSSVMMRDHPWMLNKNIDTKENLNPACRVCNKWKNTWTVEQFRKELESQISRLEKYSANYRMAKRYGLVVPKTLKVKFYFEQSEKEG